MRTVTWGVALLVGFLGAVLIVASGCGRLAVRTAVERTLQIDGMGGDNIKSFAVSAATWQQRVKVYVRTDGPAVDVYLVLERDQEALESQLSDQKAVTVQTLAKAEKVTEGEISATVPAGDGFAVVIVNNNTKKASVALKIDTEKK
jgi:hypothetical protein